MHFGVDEKSIDSKGRLTIPPHLLTGADGDTWDRVVVIRAEAKSHRALYVYDLKTWESVLEEASRTMDDDEMRLFMHRRIGEGRPSDIDSMNRITLSAPLLEHAGLDKRVVVVGIRTRLELWNPDTWKTFIAELEDVEIPSIEDLSRVRIREVC